MLQIPSYMKFNKDLHTGLFESNMNFHKGLTNEAEKDSEHKLSDLLKGQTLHTLIVQMYNVSDER